MTDPCITPTNPNPIPPGEAFDIYQILEKLGQEEDNGGEEVVVSGSSSDDVQQDVVDLHTEQSSSSPSTPSIMDTLFNTSNSCGNSSSSLSKNSKNGNWDRLEFLLKQYPDAKRALLQAQQASPTSSKSVSSATITNQTQQPPLSSSSSQSIKPTFRRINNTR